MIGDAIGNFRVVKRLGAGGMGEVYLAEHKELQTPVAVKLLNREISNNHEHVQRFFNEARIVSKIKHAGTVKIFDSGFHADQAYLIMELLDGQSLAARIEQQGALSVAQIVDIARQVASVLDATHRQGVIHRDLKPDNIFLVHDDERASGERVKILDFGIAKLSGTMSVISPKTSGTMGTPAYMAPEQWGDSANVDWRADAYSLGCVMFEMACGRPPFIAQTIPEAYTKHVMTPAPSPSQFAPSLPPELEALILRLLAKDPAERAVSMGQVTRELAELAGEPLSHEPRRPSQPVPAITATPLPPHATTLGGSAAELQAEKRRSPVALIAGLAAVVAAMVVVVVVLVVGKAKDDHHAAAPPAASPATAAPPAPAPPAPAAALPAPADAAIAAEPPPPADAAVAAVAAAPEQTVKKPKPKPVTKPKPAAGSATKPPPSDDDFGGRL